MTYSTTLLLLCFFVVGIFAYPLDINETNDTAKYSFRPVSLPTDFGSYDPNANGYIDLEELAKVTGTTLDDARKPFMDADVDDDDQVSPSEFERAPWSLNVFNREDLVSEEEQDDEDDEHIEDSNDDDEEENFFDNADDILVDVGKPVTEEDDPDKSSVEISRESKEKITEEPLEEEDDESQIVDSDEDETDEEEEEEGVDDVDTDPLLDDDLLREETVLTEDELVENAIY